MATDFIRIGGPIESAPLNTNFRRLRNDITMSNVNLKFSDSDGIKNNIKEMLEIKNPENGQTCYVVSNGSLYRYFKGDSEWHQIADFGQTYRQGFLNTGVIVMEDLLRLKPGEKNTILVPESLVYYKTLPGDDSYLRGMYRILEQDLVLDGKLSAGSTYTVAYDINRNAVCLDGIQKYDNPNIVIIGTFATDSNKNIIEEFMCTTPNIAYTADRGGFLTTGGEINGLDLYAGSDKHINRKEGIYHYEGINVTVGEVEDFPLEMDAGSNYSIKSFKAQTPTKIIYLYPERSLLNPIETASDSLIINKWYDADDGVLKDLPLGQYTIQTHLIIPNGVNIVLYGSKNYNSFDDAEAHLNDMIEIELSLPCVEVTRMIVGNVDDFNTNDTSHFKAYTLTRLAQVGTVDPQFADNEFRIFDGTDNISAPSSMRFDLGRIRGLSETYILQPQSVKDNDQLFSLEQQYTQNNNTKPRQLYDNEWENVLEDNRKGYIIPTQHSITNIHNRLSEIEAELWKIEQHDANNNVDASYNQGVRYRLDLNEKSIKDLNDEIDGQQEQIKALHKIVPHKSTTINNHPLGKNLDKEDEINSITLYTGDISEGTSNAGQTLNLWFKPERVLAVPQVETAYNHSQITTGNPHNTTTDQLIEGVKKFVSQDQLAKIEKLPNDTIAELATKIDGINLKTISGNTDQVDGSAIVDWGNMKAFRFYTDGINLQIEGTTATIECVGQADPRDFLKKTQYATAALQDNTLIGYVDKALTAKNIESLVDLEGQTTKYYGTNDEGIIGTYDLPVTTGDVKDSVSVEDIVFEPYKHSITLKHLADATVVYTNNNEESILNTNVYDLVKHHYHKVYNSGVQEEYDSKGNIIIHNPYYNYITPFGGLSERAYYFTHANVCYTFTPDAFIPANTELRFYPNTTYLVYVNNDVETEINCESISGDLVETDYLLHFISSTDWNCINEWNFGDNLTVSVVNGRATINAKDVSAGGFTNSFANLSDVNVDYNDKNVGKLLMLAKDANSNYMIRLQEVALQEYMLTEQYVEDYVEDNVNHIMKHAALANTANSANLLQNVYTVDNNSTDDQHLWSAQKVINHVSTQLNTIHKIYSGTGIPTSDIGNEGDIYIMIEE